VDGAPAADRDDSVAGAGLRDGIVEPVRRHLAPARVWVKRKLQSIPARARHDQRRADAEGADDLRQRVEAPADDHASRVRANSTNACATRVSARPPERTSQISRDGSSPATRAVATVPAPRSASIAEREMNVTP